MTTDGNRVIFTRWSEAGDGSVAGHGRVLEVVPAVPDPYTLAEHTLAVKGRRDGSSIDLSVTGDGAASRWTGSTRDHVVVFTIPTNTGALTYTFRPASSTDYDRAAKALRQSMKAEAAAAAQRAQVLKQEDAATQAAAAEKLKAAQDVQQEVARQSTAVNGANDALRAALTRLQADVGKLTSNFDPNTYFGPMVNAYRDVQSTAAHLQQDIAGHVACDQISTEIAALTDRVATLTQAKATFDAGMTAVKGQIGLVSGDVTATQTALGTLTAIIAQNPQAQPATPLLAAADVNIAIVNASALVSGRASAVDGAQQTADTEMADGSAQATKAKGAATTCGT